MEKIKAIVGSKNPVKIEAVRNAFSKYFKNIEIIGLNVGSGVSNQPKSDEETIGGAKNRATQCLTKDNEADFGIGIEGGLEYIENNLYAFAWIVIR